MNLCLHIRVEVGWLGVKGLWKKWALILGETKAQRGQRHAPVRVH